MNPRKHGEARLKHLIRSFGCDSIPRELFIRACNPKVTWTSTGEVSLRMPEEGAVPKWLLDLYASNNQIFHDQELFRKLVMQSPTPDFTGQFSLEIDPLHQFPNKHTIAHERIAIVLHAFPSVSTEIVGEETMSTLKDVVLRSLLPLLSSLTEADIKDWLVPPNPDEKISFLYALFEFIYQVFDVLGCEFPSLPVSFLNLVLNYVSQEIPQDCLTFCGGIIEMIKVARTGSCDISKLGILSSLNERCNAMFGTFLAVLFSSSATQPGSDTLNTHLINSYSKWQPLSTNAPSSMEYLAAHRLWKPSQLASIGPPPHTTVDVLTLCGFGLSRQREYEIAAKSLRPMIPRILVQRGAVSMEFALTVAELGNCLNVLRQEKLAEEHVSKALEMRRKLDPRDKQGEVYLQFCLIDSFIGQAKYKEASPILQRLFDDDNTAEAHRTMVILRLAKIRRRQMKTPLHNFGPDGLLSKGAAQLSKISTTLQELYVEEVACNVSLLSDQDTESQTCAMNLMQHVSSILSPSKSITHTPSFEFYTKIQQRYVQQAHTDTNVVPERAQSRHSHKLDESSINPRDEVPINEALLKPEQMSQSAGNPNYPSSLSTVEEITNTLGHDTDLVDEGNPWWKKTALTIDEQGIARTYSSLLILEEIMSRIRKLERDHPEGPAFSSSAPSEMLDEFRESSTSRKIYGYLPCHYFDYITGASTGGFASIMLGRLRMTVNEALYGFEVYNFALFPSPRSLHSTSLLPVPRHKHSSRKVYRAIRASPRIFRHTRSVTRESFLDRNFLTRTITFCIADNGDRLLPHKWRSYLPCDPKPRFKNPDISIEQVIYATIANSKYMGKMKIEHLSFKEDTVPHHSPEMLTLEEIRDNHDSHPALFVAIGINSRMSGETNEDTASEQDSDSTILRREPHDSGSLEAKEREAETKIRAKSWAEYQASSAFEDYHKFDTRSELNEIAFDEWRPADTGSETRQKITKITSRYLDLPKVSAKIDAIAKRAVDIRRARARTHLWKIFTVEGVKDPYYPHVFELP